MLKWCVRRHVILHLHIVVIFTRRCTKLYRKAPTRRRIDHFAAGVTYLQFLVQVCFSSTSTSQPGLPNFTVAFRRKSNIFLLWPWTFDLWLWPTNLTQIGSRWTTTPNADIKVHSVGKLSSKHANTHTRTHTHTHAHSWSTALHDRKMVAKHAGCRIWTSLFIT